MIKNWDFLNLKMDFSSMWSNGEHPVDIDMLLLGRNDTLLIGEIKNENGCLKDRQRRLIEKLVKGWKGNALAIYVTHDKYIQKGDKVVDVSECRVQEMYAKNEGRWRRPNKPLTVREVVDYIKED